LFGALFEGINFSSIPSKHTLGVKYLPLYRTNNKIILNKIMQQRAWSLTFAELKLKNNNNWKSCATLTLKIENYKNAAKKRLISTAIICKNVTSELRVTKLDDTTCNVYLRIQSSNKKFRVSFFLSAIQNGFEKVTYQLLNSGECDFRTGWGWGSKRWEFAPEGCDVVLFHVQILSMEVVTL
jgi:hypothetical protein